MAYQSGMFTGIVEEVGQIESLDKRAGALELVVASHVVVKGVAVGDSVSVEGVCLTTTQVGDNRFTFEVVPETLARTHLGVLQVGQQVNLEGAMRVGRTFGGHYVQGHIDACARIVSREPDGEALNLHLQVPHEHGHYLLEKGFVALDGVSLTLVSVVTEGLHTRFSVTLVPHTQKAVTLGKKAVNAKVNVEVDIHTKAVVATAAAKFDDLQERVERLEAALQDKLDAPS